VALSVNGPKEYCPLPLAVVCDVVVVAFGSVMVAVTPWFGVAPLPLTVNCVTPATPEVGETLLLRTALLTCSVVESEADKPTVEVAVQVTS
jgi:hypothetical protein